MKLTLLALSSGLSVNAAVVSGRRSPSVVNRAENIAAARPPPKVIGAADGFATGTTGGGNASCFVAETTEQLKTWLEDDLPRCIVVEQELDFKFKEGFTTETGCRPASNTCPGKGGQDAINKSGFCDSGSAGNGSKPVSVTYDNAGVNPINVNSNKSLIGVGRNGIIRGKGLRIANGAHNVIIQNIHITELNPQYIWGGDAISLDGSDRVWVDHCKFSLIGNQMFVTGLAASNRVTVSNTEFSGQTNWSESCDGLHYWTFMAIGANDLITMKGNNIHHTSGLSPKLGGNTLVHAVNNLWAENSGHAFDNEKGSKVLLEGNVFQNVKKTIMVNKGQLFAPSGSDVTKCDAILKRSCVANSFLNSPAITAADATVLESFKNRPVAQAGVPDAESIRSKAGVGKI